MRDLAIGITLAAVAFAPVVATNPTVRTVGLFVKWAMWDLLW